eukprot:s2258_g4.t1
MARRVERLMLGTPLVPRSITAIRVVCRDNKVASDWMSRFLPMLRYASPNLEFNFSRLPAIAVKEKEETSEAGVEADEAESGADTPADSQQDVADQSPALEETPEVERIELEFSDGTKHLLNMELYVSSHQVMQRILDVDAEKTLAT